MSFQMDKIASWAVVWRPWLTPNAWVSSASTDSNYHSDKSASQRFMRSKASHNLALCATAVSSTFRSKTCVPHYTV